MKITKAMGHACVDAMDRSTDHCTQLHNRAAKDALGQLGWMDGSDGDAFGLGEHSAHLQLALCMAATISGVI